MEASKKRASQYFGKYSDYQNEWKRQQTQNNTEYNIRRKELKKALYDANKEAINKKRRERYATDMFCPDRKYNRAHDVKDKTPNWVNLDEILHFYSKCPIGYEVDHIIPLNGKIDGRPVTGLHVLYNLQYLPADENRKKYCLITEEYLSHFEVKR